MVMFLAILDALELGTGYWIGQWCAQNRIMVWMAVRRTGWIEGCGADRVLTDPDVIRDWFWNASKAGGLSVLDGWLETKPSLFVYLGHVGMVG
ncbi:hypothetical protein F2Q70_00012348 [Brassica cretica]|uniref:Uncharacterized protein n=1 Tax=Brassica cretica TaxID=69181 RepID=A0A8S9MF16_BRACR|nr:hypothetical protein F2Q70_00012348 [Brassica cretica]